jgi:hypothetical protein
MELSVLGQSTTTVSAVALTQHTHHITMNDPTVTSFETIEASGCPTFKPATSGPVLVVSGQATVTANGQTDTPFAPQGQPSQLTLCLSGGTGVPYANITLQFGSPASTHFGSQAIHGVIRKTGGSDDDHGNHQKLASLASVSAGCGPRGGFPEVLLANVRALCLVTATRRERFCVGAWENFFHRGFLRRRFAWLSFGL